MGTRVETIIIEPRLLVREALESLMENYSYRVVCRVGSTADIQPIFRSC
jgi:two-component system nitrate/nitrite response regulator NarL